MNLRTWANQHPGLVAVGAVLVSGIAVGAIAMRSRTHTYPLPNSYFYDLGSGTIITVKGDTVPPINGPSGKLAVRAYVYSCGDCANAATRDIYYLEMYTPNARGLVGTTVPAAPTDAAPEAKAARDAEIIHRGHMISAKEPINWVQADSPAANQVLDKAGGKCGGKPVKMCVPENK